MSNTAINHRYNPAYKHKGCFNEQVDAPTDFWAIDPQDAQRQADRLERLKAQTYDNLAPVSEIDRLEN